MALTVNVKRIFDARYQDVSDNVPVDGAPDAFNIADGSLTPAKLAPGSDTQVLTTVGSTVEWAAAPSGGGGVTGLYSTVVPRGAGADDHTALQAAFDAGGRIGLSGEYYTSKPLEWVHSSTYLDCDNTRATIIHCHPSWDSTGTNPDRQMIRNWREADWTVAETNYRIVPIKAVTFPVVGGQNVYPRIRGTLQLKPDGKPNIALFSWCGPNETSNVENLILSGGYDFIAPNTDHNLGTWGIDLQGAQNGGTFGQVTFYGNGWARQISIDAASVPGHAVGGGNVWFKGPVTFSPGRNYEAVIYVQDVFDVEFETAHFESCNDASSLATIYLNSCFGFKLNGGSFDMNTQTDNHEANHKPFLVQSHLGSQGTIERPPIIKDFLIHPSGNFPLFANGVPLIQDLWNTIPHVGALGPNLTIPGNGIGLIAEYDGMKIAFTDLSQSIYEHYFQVPDIPSLTDVQVNTGYLSCAGVNGNPQGYETPDHADFDLSTGLDLRALIWPTAWANGVSQYLVAKSKTTNQFSYRFEIDATGHLQVLYSTDGSATTALFSSVAVTDIGAAQWVRVAADGSATTFYTSPDGITWTQLGSARAALSGSLFNSTSVVEVAMHNLNSNYAGKFYRAEVRDSSAVLKGAFDARLLTQGQSYTGPNAHVWTPETKTFIKFSQAVDVSRLIDVANVGSVAVRLPLQGAGSPESVVTGTVGMLYTRTDGGAGTTLYVKESGSGNTGWIAK